VLRRMPSADPTEPRRRLTRLGAQGLVLALVAGASTAFAVLHSTVTVDVDGDAVQVSTFGRTVGDVLADAGVETGDHDLVAPALDAAVTDGGEIVVRHGRQIDVEVDGDSRTVWTTALTVGEAMGDLGVRGDGARVSASRSAALGRGDVLRVSTEKTVHVAVDGTVVDAVTAAPTVREALQEAGLVLGERDHVSVPLEATTVDGLMVQVTRAVTGTVTEVQQLPFTESVVEDPTLTVGERRVETEGQAGERQIVYAVETLGGAEIARSVVSDMHVREPVNRVVKVGTKPVPVVAPRAPASPARSGGGSAAPAPAAPAAPIDVDPGSAQGIARSLAAARGWGDDQFSCLVQLWNRESGWRVNAENRSSGAYGIPQALPGSKMASVAGDWRTNPATQITWGLNYISGRYGTPCGAWGAFQSKGWY
jgi:resuscitation-promoting factor RpfB